MPDDPVFANEQFMSGAQKKKVLRAWDRFLKSGCAKSQFTQDLYHHLIQHCSLIAHFDRHGFYNFYFERITTDLFRFFDQFDPKQPGISAEYGGTHWLSKYNTGSDLNQAMREVAGTYLQSLRRTFEEVRRQRDIGAASCVLATYGLAVVPATISSAATADVSAEAAPRSAVGSVQQELFAE
jgi:hypothetical protein